jgi:transposase
MRRTERMKIIEMLRLRKIGLKHREIAAASGCAKSTVGDVLKLCNEKGVNYDVAVQMNESELHNLLYPPAEVKHQTRPEPDWKKVQEDLAKHPSLNLQFLWEEYREQHPDGLSYSRYCIHYRQYCNATTGKQLSLVHERRGGEIMQVDWMGDTLLCVRDTESGECVAAHFFVSVMGRSGLPYVEAFPNEQEPNWIKANVNALHNYGGVPRIIEPDNVKTAVKTPKYYEPIINSAYWELARHYEVAIVPARIRKPKDKPLVEQSVGWLETWLLGKLRNQVFFSFYELNQSISIYMAELVKRPFQKREGSRWSEFQEYDKPALRPLPAQRYEIADIVFRSVPDNYHIAYAGFYYSVPYILCKERVTLRASDAVIEIFDKNHNRVASHRRRYNSAKGCYISDERHMPPNHRAVHQSRQFDETRYRRWAGKIGVHTYSVIDGLLTGGAVPEQGYKACMGILQFSKTYGDVAVEAACERARAIGSPTYTTIKGIIKGITKVAAAATPEHENIRGSAYYK